MPIQSIAEVCVPNVLARSRSPLSKLPPPAQNVKRHLTNVISGRFKQKMKDDNIEPKLVMQEARALLFEEFQKMGLRTALWDRNV